jgi:VIT1/CCC1 family predicted Fe2+/Mn2+ transporter
MMSSFFSLNKRDAINGLIVAFLSAALAGTIAALEAGVLPSIDALKADGLFGLKAAGAYLLKNLFTNSQDQFLNAEK